MKKSDELQCTLPPGIDLSPLRAKQELDGGHVLVSELFPPPMHG